MSKYCCSNAPQVFVGGKWSCSECGSITQNEISKLIDEFTEWQLTSGAFKSETEKTCQCGSDKSYGRDNNAHSDYCPKYKKP